MDSSDQVPLDGPPRDADDWTDEQWIDWLKKTDADGADAPTRPATTLGRITHTAGGAALGQAMLGMANAIYGRKDNEIVIVVEGSSQPEGDEPLSVRLDPEHPERSVIVLRNQGPTRPGQG